jgi:uncharacterized protein
VRQVAVDWAGVPLPDIAEPELAPYWEGCREGRLRVPRCRDCGRDLWPPRAACWHCGSLEREWRAVPGSGKLFTWTVVGHTPILGFKDAVPFAVGVVELDGVRSVRMVGRLLTAPEALRVTAPVCVEFEKASADVWLPAWRVQGAPEVPR